MDKLPENITPELILAFLKGQVDKDDADLVQNWMDGSEGNHLLFEQYKVIWEETGKLIPAPVDLDIDTAWNNMSSRIDQFEERYKIKQDKTVQVIPLRKYILRVAAVLVPLIIFSSIYIIMNRGPKIIIKETTAQTYKDTLSDGSILAMSKQSKISYPLKFEGNTREVEMVGEVFFEVKPNKDKPFIIHAEEVLIKVLGTSFNVKSFADSSNVEVSVKTGRVLFSGMGSNYADTVSLILLAGETGIYHKATNKMEKLESPEKEKIQQSRNVLIFNRTKLSQVADSLHKKYGVTISFKGEDLKSYHFSATFKDLSIDSIMNVLVNTFDFKLKRQGSIYILEQNEE
jgi:transmembrane sensor